MIIQSAFKDSISETYLYKNGLTNGVGPYLSQTRNKVKSVYMAAAGIGVTNKPFVHSGSTINEVLYL